MLVKGFLNARDILVKELQKISKAINRAIDVNDFASKHEVKELLSFPTDADSAIDANAVSGQAPSSRQNVSKVLSSCGS